MLTVHRAERTDVLADALADIVSQPLADPFASEVVAVPARGVERWLQQALARRLGVGRATTTDHQATAGSPGIREDGVAANIDFRSPTEIVDAVLTSVRGADRHGDVDPGRMRREDDAWSPRPLVWSVLRVIDDSLDDPECAVLARHLGVRGTRDESHRAGRRLRTAADLASLFRSYAAQRPHMLRDWSAGADTDGAGGDLADDHRWQAHIWRRLRARLDTPSPAEDLPRVCEAIRSDPRCVPLPERLSLFGPTRLTTEQLDVVSALGHHRDVHVFVPHPSPVAWSRGATYAVPDPTTPGRPVPRSAIRRPEGGNPLLAGLGREVDELWVRMTPRAGADVHHPGPVGGTSLLARLQNTVREDRAPRPDDVTHWDGTVAFHACHGPARQVEVARDEIARLFADDPTLTPRDVVVMCPDVETYAPLVRAAFDPESTGHPAGRLRVRLADRALAATNPVLDAIVVAVALAGARVTAAQVADFAARELVRRRFRFTDDDLETIGRWLADSGVRWGIGSTQRTAFGLDGFEQNTLTTGLDRLTLGAVADDESLEWLGRVLPLGVDSADVDLLGRFTDFCARLDACLDRLTSTQSAESWTTAMIAVVDDLLDVPEAQTWQRGQAVEEVVRATESGDEVILRRADVASLMDRLGAARPTRANFRTGELTVCSMVPMRTVPHRVVVLVGLDDDVYPRVTHVDGDDVLGVTPLVGERDPRGEDRQLLLDTIMSTRERMLICFTGADPVSGLRRPPSVAVSEIIDAVAALVPPADRDHIVERHTLHAFDPDNFTGDPPRSFDLAALAGARALAAPPVHRLRIDRRPLPPAPRDDVDVADLIAFFDNPVRGFCRQRLGFTVPDADDVLDDDIRVVLSGLRRWSVGDRLLRARLDGVDAESLVGAELRRGTLPPFDLGRRELEPVLDAVDRLAGAALPISTQPASAVEVDLDLGSGRRLRGTVDGVHGTTVLRAHYAGLSPRHRLATWIGLLCVRAGSDTDPTDGVTLGRWGRTARRSEVRAPHDPVGLLRELIDVRDAGLRAPLPIPTDAAARYAERRDGGLSHEEALSAARDAFDERFGDTTDRHVRLLFPGGFDDVLSDHVTGPHTDFASLADSVWRPMLAHERVTRV